MVSVSKASFSLISVFSLISATLSHLTKTPEGPRRADSRPMKGGNETHNGEGPRRPDSRPMKGGNETHNGEGPRRPDSRPMKGSNETHDCEGE